MQACSVHAAVSIVETKRQYLKSTHGTTRACIPRSMSFCQFAFLPRLPVVLVVEDTLEDERYFSTASLCTLHCTLPSTLHTFCAAQ